MTLCVKDIFNALRYSFALRDDRALTRCVRGGRCCVAVRYGGCGEPLVDAVRGSARGASGCL